MCRESQRLHHCRPDQEHTRCTLSRRSQHTCHLDTQCTVWQSPRPRQHGQMSRRNTRQSPRLSTALLDTGHRHQRSRHLQLEQSGQQDTQCMLQSCLLPHRNQPNMSHTPCLLQNHHQSSQLRIRHMQMPLHLSTAQPHRLHTRHFDPPVHMCRLRSSHTQWTHPNHHL